jgi:hypothetical protein
MTVPATSGDTTVNTATEHAEISAERASGGARVEFRDLRRSFGTARALDGL